VTLQHEMRQLLAEMTLLSYGTVQSWNASGGSESPGRPGGEAWPLADKWHAEFQRNPSRETLDAARAELVAWKRRAAPAEGDGSTEDDWVLRDGEGFSAEQVARKFNRTPSMVRRLRLANGRESEFGLSASLPRGRERVPDARARVVNLAGQGCTLKQIELQTGVPRETVRRWMKEAA
jgi:hypothetical protein